MDTTLDDPLVGRVLDGRYRVDARIAAGGMATVYRALDTRLDRVLALKVMHPALAADAAFVDRFIREAKSVARLAHPNVVAVFDQGTDGPYTYLAMEYVSGCTLRDVLRERGALQPRAALDILEPVLAALGAAHRAGFVHRDMKPENVLIGDDGRVKVADFGLVRSVDSVTNTTGSVLGTVSYLAPEQIENGVTDTRVDVYACGVVLYEMLTGAKPHTGGTAAQVLYQHLNEDVPPPSATVPGLPVALDELVAHAAARNPDLRPYDAAALLGLTLDARAQLSEAELDSVPPQARAEERSSTEDRTSVIPRPVAEGQQPVHHTSRLQMPTPPAPAARSRDRRPRRGTLLVIAGVLLALGLGTGVWYINSGQFTQVPNLLGKSEAQARSELTEAGIGVKRVERRFSGVFDRGTVMDTDPAGGKRIRGNGSVTITVSRGPEVVAVPDLTGKPLEEAKAELTRTGLAPGIVTQVFSQDVAQGSVISTSPAGGQKRAPDTAIALVVSKGRPVQVPNVAGRPVDQARAALQDLGLKVETAAEQVNSPFAAGTVANQSVGAGTQAAAGDTVTLTLSKGPRPVQVPNVVGQEVDAARKTLEAAGFKVKVERPFLSFSNTVDAQSVAGGQNAPEGSTITLRTKGL
ncbi:MULTISPECIES: Stk1 family PASTA domain-containing Ser/Thr kinase [unclassified Streptomyces]|uniref:Stk1 family PASTA domain-containing Ser/Thr kinase n=1 Tax=unclassified Streptomyces TaxID=2593676 RepID=UPI001BED1246|nr:MULTISPECIES: Stk1 family PASTA domain-containing Ser/Thr kinase [unclassified Streptomyces]MBT2405922.1 Stk1 family PASTA domain-containing Ser/Thr kinase [Streptomyces sp. ISL-21]MBT2453960.1 Stk1 family PASTA domain-containing Ser/Thr kinase [Streptomyces sp. ISL-86]MBT2612260.1 Stk1 family PASTA domain-containing Ser/Thr kinase [Streptomyces sp. ISL-87]